MVLATGMATERLVLKLAAACSVPPFRTRLLFTNAVADAVAFPALNAMFGRLV